MVTSLLLIAALIVMPRFTGIMESVKLKSDARQIAWVLKKARYNAIAGNEGRIIFFYEYDTLYKMDKGSIYRLSPGIRYERVTFNYIGDTCCRGCSFNSSGIPGGGGTVALKNKNGDKIYVIVSAVAGRIRISDIPPP
ncbi:MAG: hypothetical protein PHR65_09275 [Syntrophomonadaceae bacterium]|nr:hypothetical protein [Syntrophomonadaceae bacterium]MDD3890098.1 hypothetical protein [Syntrophomonadaceae bacterium]